MKALSAPSLLALAAVAVVPVQAQAQRELAQQNHCLGCHAVDRKVVGPAYRDVAAKYAGQPDAVARLAEKIRRGGAGVWGRCRCRPIRRSAKPRPASSPSGC